MRNPLFLFLLLCFFSSSILAQDLIPYKKGDFFGFADPTGQIVIEPEYQKVQFFNPKGYALAMKDRKVYIIDSLGKKITDFKDLQVPQGSFDNLKTTQGQFYEFKLGNQVGILDSLFRLLILTEGSRIEKSVQGNFYKISARNREGLVYGVADENGKMILPFAKGSIRVHTVGEEKAVVFSRKQKPYLSLFDHTGKRIFEDKYERFDSYLLAKNGFFVAYAADYFDIYDQNMDLVKANLTYQSYDKPSVYDVEEKHRKLEFSKIFDKKRGIECWTDGLKNQCICVAKNLETKEYRVYNNGQKILTDKEQYFNKNHAWQAIVYKTEDKRGVKNYEGKTIVAPEFDRILSSSIFENILAEKEGDFQFYLPNGAPLDGQLYDKANAFSLRKKGQKKYALHDGSGIPQTEFIYDTLLNFYDYERFYAEKGAENYILNQSGKKVTELNITRRDKIPYTKFWRVLKEGKFGVLNPKGDWVLRPEFVAIEKINGHYANPLFLVKKEDGTPRFYNEYGAELQIGVEEVHGFQRVHAKHFVRLSSKDGREVIFNKKGEQTLVFPQTTRILEKGNLVEKNLVLLNGVYANFETGVVFGEQ